MEMLLQLDYFIFDLLNRRWTWSVLDWFFPIWTDFHKSPLFHWIILPLLFAVFFYYRRLSGVIFLLATALAVGLDDWFCGKVLKPLIGRPRPPLSGIEVILRSPHYGGSSFPSNHAANMFCLFVFVGFFFPRLRWPLFIMAALTAYSRVYCGVHFPSDVIGGALIGSLIGYALARAFQAWWLRIQQRRHPLWQKS